MRLPLPPSETACASVPLSPAPDLLAHFERLRVHPYPWLLDSALPSERLGRFSFAGADPYLVLRARGGRVGIEVRRAVRPGLGRGRHVVAADPLEVLRALLPAAPGGASGLPFAGGAVGYFGYELAQELDAVLLRAADDLGLDDAVLLFTDRLFALDHRDGAVSCLGLGFGPDPREARRRAERAAEDLAARVGPGGRARPGERRARAARSEMARATSHPSGAGRGAGGPGRPARAVPCELDEWTYAKAVGTIRDEIADGNVYQANLTHRVEREFRGDPWALYRSLRALNPAPFACYLELPEVAVVGSSPERFLGVGRDGRVESRPIKGTRPRGAHPVADERLRRELGASPKDRAENVMIVDLVRNDLGRVCAVGSVAVPELAVVEPYAAVFQLVSTVEGRLAPGRDAIDLLRAAFPPGSMTGAPKLAAMRLLDRLEPVRRSIYSGAIGYLDAGGGADLCVVIRTILVRDGRAYVHAGGGVVADSDPVGEWQEARDKSRPLLEALEACTPRRALG